MCCLSQCSTEKYTHDEQRHDLTSRERRGGRGKAARDAEKKYWAGVQSAVSQLRWIEMPSTLSRLKMRISKMNSKIEPFCRTSHVYPVGTPARKPITVFVNVYSPHVVWDEALFPPPAAGGDTLQNSSFPSISVLKDIMPSA